MATLEKDLERLEGSLDKLSKEVVDIDKTLGSLDKTLGMISLRLDNGQKSFKTIQDDIEALNVRTAPKVPSIAKIVSITLVVVSMGATALWGLHGMLRDRPTDAQIEKILEKHDGNGHSHLREDVSKVREEQLQQRTTLKDIKEGQAKFEESTNKKLDKLLERRR